MLKIASLVPYKIIPAVTGGEKGIFYFLKYVARYADITSFSVTENAGAVERINFIDVLGSTHKKSRYADFSVFRKIKNTCRSLGIKHIIVEHPYLAWLGVALKKWGGLKLIIHSHNIEAARFKSVKKWWWPILYQYERFAHRQADFNFFITEEDKDYAIRTYRLDTSKCAVVTYGIEHAEAPSFEEKQQSKKQVCEELDLPIHTKLILFNGTLDYAPNRDGLDRILKEINPLLQQQAGFSYKIIICGLRLPAEYNRLKNYEGQHIIYKGFVEDISIYFKAADLFINPITDGGGIKTKLVEALAANTPCVSFKAGAYGVPVNVTGDHLLVVPDGDNRGFASSIEEQLSNLHKDIPEAFYDHFSWDAIARKTMAIIEGL
ncbi:glycosyltransferase family 4 protein [Niabella hibiscisoli]|uniref:glycosyltransferase family 4 protein n=1 Tax=Niabella hibiscisoli TaxID=1825928 RepID=UPI001F0D8190|nr:glycosyltransferase family 4 protein [Niabella hibiscisoli]MCH5717216.1 glycosyltransferase family 4 protein [Niabella hibiscisoli]